jgi:hypothetical protein
VLALRTHRAVSLRRPRLLALLVVPLLLVAACGSGGDSSSGGASGASKTAGSGKQVTDLADVQVSDKVGE